MTSDVRLTPLVLKARSLTLSSASQLGLVPNVYSRSTTALAATTARLVTSVVCEAH